MFSIIIIALFYNSYFWGDHELLKHHLTTTLKKKVKKTV